MSPVRFRSSVSKRGLAAAVLALLLFAGGAAGCVHPHLGHHGSHRHGPHLRSGDGHHGKHHGKPHREHRRHRDRDRHHDDHRRHR